MNTFRIFVSAKRGDTLSAMEFPDRKSYLNEVGRRLKAARNEADITQGQAADALTMMGFVNDKGDPVGSSLVGNWEQGKRFPRDPRVFNSLAKLYNVSASWILCTPEGIQDERQRKLNEVWKETDERGRQAIWGVAESQPTYQIGRAAKEKSGS